MNGLFAKSWRLHGPVVIGAVFILVGYWVMANVFATAFAK